MGLKITEIHNLHLFQLAGGKGSDGNGHILKILGLTGGGDINDFDTALQLPVLLLLCYCRMATETAKGYSKSG